MIPVRKRGCKPPIRQRDRLLDGLPFAWRMFLADNILGNVSKLQAILDVIDAIQAGERDAFEETGNAWTLTVDRRGRP